jgi:hypothetical protein
MSDNLRLEKQLCFRLYSANKKSLSALRSPTEKARVNLPTIFSYVSALATNRSSVS